MTTIPDFWTEIIAELTGTCKSESELGDEGEALFNNLEFCEHLDQEIFRCAECSWWCEISEEASEDHGRDELTCLDCCT